MIGNFNYDIPCHWTDGIKQIKPTNTLTFTAGTFPDWVFRINFDASTVELNDGVTWDDAAKLFWEHVARNAPNGFTVERKGRS